MLYNVVIDIKLFSYSLYNRTHVASNRNCTEMLKIKILSEDIYSINSGFTINVLIANNVCSVGTMIVVGIATATTQ